ncbi:sulfotransferase [Dyella agri]|uniref:Sulfotransferase n=2 Tax=Dyella agri TaxID=1926869 RepID=A0ABW8KEP3_9GAMM
MSSDVGQEAPSLPDTLRRAWDAWHAGMTEQAHELGQRALAAWPGQPDALHLLGLMEHAAGKLDQAITHLHEACRAPSARAVHVSDLAELCRQRGWLADAEVAARRAVTMDPSLLAGWNNLGVVLKEAGRFEESRACLERVIAHRPDWAEAHNNLANTCRRLGCFELAERHYRRALALQPGYAQAHSNLAYLWSEQGHYEVAMAEARRAIALNPHLVEAYLNLAEVEGARRHHDAALQALDQAFALAPQNPFVLVACATALCRLQRLPEALRFARDAVACAPQRADAHHALATVLKSLGQTDEALIEFEHAVQLPGTWAEEALLDRALLLQEAGREDEADRAFERALEAFPDSATILAGRADRHTFTADDPAFALFDAFLAEGTRHPLRQRIAMHFALGKAYLDVKDPAHAFAHFDEGNRLHRATFDYDAAAEGRWMAKVAATFTAGRCARLTGLGEATELPVFVIGMPRSGTTLIEQILASHPLVTGAGELSALQQVFECQGNYPDSWAALADARTDDTRPVLKQLGRAYLEQVAPLAQGRLRVIDKMPANHRYAGAIPSILPGARIIHVRRDPVDTCLSCYTKLFAGDQSFTYDQTELGAYYRDYEQLMAHWRRVLPADRFLEVDYEAVIEDLEGEARRMVAFLGLPWDDACLRFHESRRVVLTASVNQVRRPIYTSSKGRWQGHAAYLQPLLQSLGHASGTVHDQAADG